MPDTTWLDRVRSYFRPASPALPATRADADGGGSAVANPYTGLGGAYDKGSVARPNPWVIPLSLQELRSLYVYNGVARRIVDILPSRACRRGWSVPEIGTEDERLELWGKVCQGMAMGDLYGDAVGLIVTEDDVPAGPFRSDPYAWLAQPLDLQRVGRVVGFHIFDALQAQPLRFVRDPRSPAYRLPELWRLTDEGFSAVVHHSRVVLFRGSRRPPSETRGGWGSSGLPDDSRLQVIWDELRRLSETLNGGAVLAQEIRESILKINDLAGKMTGDAADLIEARMQVLSQSRGLLGIGIIGKDDQFESRSNPPTGFDQLSAAAWEALAAVTGIPQVILMGSTPGGLNTDGGSSWEGFRQLVSSYQESHRHGLQWLYTVLLSAQDGPTRGRLPEGGAVVTFAALDEPDQAAIAETRATVATTDIEMMRAGVYTAADVARSRYGAGGWSIDLQPVEPPAPKAADASASPFATVGLPALVQAGIISRSGARALLGVDESLAPSPEDLALLVANPTASAVQPPRADAVDPGSVVVLIPAADPGLRAQVEAAVGQTLTVEGDPHVTVLYLGTGLPPDAVAEVVDVVDELADDLDPSMLLGSPTLRAFPPGPSGTPIVLEYGDGWALSRYHDRLLVALAHRVTARQHPTYRPHLTIGYAAEPLTPDQAAALLAIDTTAPALRVPIGQVEVRVGEQVVARVEVGALEQPEAEDPPEPADPSPTPATPEGEPPEDLAGAVDDGG